MGLEEETDGVRKSPPNAASVPSREGSAIFQEAQHLMRARCEDRTTTLQISVYPECRFRLLVHLKPTLRSKYICIGIPYVTVPTK